MVCSHGNSSRVKAKNGGVSVLLSCPICTSGKTALRNPESIGAPGTVERTTPPADGLKVEDYLTGLAILLCLAMAIWG